MIQETELGREVRAAVAAALKRFGENDIAAIKVSDLRKLDAYLNPKPEGFEIAPRNDRPFHTELALKQAARVREADQAGGFDKVLATIAAHKAAGLREVSDNARLVAGKVGG